MACMPFAPFQLRPMCAVALTDWQPHLVILDMDLDGAQIMAALQAKPIGGYPLAGDRSDPPRRPAGPSWPRSTRAWTTS